MAFLSLIAKLGLDGSGFQRGLQQAEKGAGNLSKTLGKAFGATAIAAVIATLSKKTLDLAGDLADMSDRTGVSTDQLQQFKYAAEQGGSSLKTFGEFLERLNENRINALRGNQEMIDSFAALGVGVEDLKNLPVDQLAKKIGNMVRDGDVSLLIEDLKDVGGKGASELVAAFKGGLDEAGEEAKKLGLIIDADVVEKLAHVGDRLSTVVTSVMSKLAPLLGWVADMVQAIIDQIGRANAVMQGLKEGGMRGAGSALTKYDGQIATREGRLLEAAQNRKLAAKPNFSAIANKTEAKKAEQADKEAAASLKRDEDEITRLQGQKLKPVEAVESDALAKIGGMVGGATVFDPTVFVAKDQLAELKKIHAAIDEIRNRGRTNRAGATMNDAFV